MASSAPETSSPNSVSADPPRSKRQTEPVKAVNSDHQKTMRVITRRGPQTSPSQPPGTSNRA